LSMLRRLFLTSMLCAPMAAEAAPLSSMAENLLSEHPQIQSLEHSVRAAKAGKKEAFAGYLPRVDANMGYGYEALDRRSQRPARTYTDESTLTRRIAYNHNLFDGLRTTANYESADVNLNLTENTLRLVKQQLLLEAATAYLDVLRQVELASLSEDNVANLQKQLELEDARVERGSGIAVDVLQSKSRLQIALERQAAFGGAMKDARARFLQVFNEDASPETMELPNVPLEEVPPTVEEAAEMAARYNFDIQNSEYASDIAQLSRKSARAGYYPSVDFVSSYNVDNNVAGINGTEERAAATMNTSWNLFNGLADRARIKRAAEDYESAQENLRYSKRKTEESVKLAWSALVTSKQRLELLDNAVNIAGEVFDARKRLRDAGKDTAINVLDAENELFRARIDAASARYDYYIAVYRILQAMGKLDPQLVTAGL
jgi:adhesin transport system outer membrane protein